MNRIFLKLSIFNLLISVTTYLLCSKLLFKKTNFPISLEKQFLFFTISLLIITTISYFVQKRNKDIVGMVFMATTVVKTFATFFIFKSIVNISDEMVDSKTNFFLLYMFFLALETLATIILLNKKQ